MLVTKFLKKRCPPLCTLLQRAHGKAGAGCTTELVFILLKTGLFYDISLRVVTWRLRRCTAASPSRPRPAAPECSSDTCKQISVKITL